MHHDDSFLSVVSADKREMPLLAFSDEGDLDVDDLENISPELIFWMAMMEEEINSIRDGEPLAVIDSKEAALVWNDIETVGEVLENSPNGRTNAGCPPEARCDDPGNTPPPPVTVGPLMSTEWGQRCGYNNVCPVNSKGPCGRALTGCVAVAMAQVMRYHQHPSNYTWSGMGVTSSASSDPRHIARIMYDAGVSVGMDWDWNESTASTADVAGALKGSMFKYSSATWRNSRNYSSSEVKNNLKYRRPVILRGKRSKAGCFLGICDYKNGHAWVCDGYKTYNTECCGYLYFYMNWGWEGSNNGWFAYNKWSPPASGNYQYDRGAVVNIKP